MSMLEGTAAAQGNGQQTTRSMKGLDVIHPGAAGLDLHKEVIFAPPQQNLWVSSGSGSLPSV